MFWSVLFNMSSKESNKLKRRNIESDKPKKLSRNVTRRSMLKTSGAVISTATAGGAALGLTSRPAQAFSCTEKDQDPYYEYQYGAHPDEGGMNEFKLHHTGTLQWYDTCYDNYNDIKEVILIAGYTAAMEYDGDPYEDIEWSRLDVYNYGDGVVRPPQGSGHIGQYAHAKQDDGGDDFYPELSQWSAPLLSGLRSNTAGAIATAAAAAYEWAESTYNDSFEFKVNWDYETHRATIGFGTMFKVKLEPDDEATLSIRGTTSDSTSEGYQTYSRIQADIWRQSTSRGSDSDRVKWDVSVENGYEMED
jgi:hypothetical protein